MKSWNYNKIIFSIFTGMTLVIPVFMNPWGGKRYELDKISLFMIGVELILFFWLWQKGSVKNIIQSIKTVLKSREIFSLNRLFLCFLFIYAVACFFSISPMDSFWGLIDRRFGFFTILHLVCLFWLFPKVEPRSDYWKKLIWGIVFVSGVISLYAILQKFGIEFVPKTSYVTMRFDKSIIRPMANMGHPNYLGAYLVMILPFVYYLFSLKNKLYKKLTLLFVLILQLSAAYLTLNRGAWLGLAGGSWFFLITQFFVQRKASKKRVGFYLKKILYGCLIMAVFLSFWWGVWGFGGEDRNLENKIDTGSIYVRLQRYEFAASIIKISPFIGFGPETYLYADLHRSLTEKELLFDNRMADRVHNLVLDTAYSIGLLGLLALVLIFYKIGSTGFKILKSKLKFKYKYLALGAGASIFGY